MTNFLLKHYFICAFLMIPLAFIIGTILSVIDNMIWRHEQEQWIKTWRKIHKKHPTK